MGKSARGTPLGVWRSRRVMWIIGVVLALVSLPAEVMTFR